MRRAVAAVVVMVVAAAVWAGAAAQPGTPAAGSDPLHRPFDQILDINVRDGFVYYRALQSSRGALDRYVASLNVSPAAYEALSREARMALWVNAYNAAVLQSVVGRYPIKSTNDMYPDGSVRQIPGLFDTVKRRVAGRSLTLDEIEKTVLPEFKEPRLYLALGRGAVGSGRLLSEAWTAERMARQLDLAQKEFVDDRNMLNVDRGGGTITATPILSWHEAEFVAAYEKAAPGSLSSRSPIERALVGLIMPNLLRLEKQFVEEGRFKVSFHAFDWRLNDLTGGRID